MMSLGHGIGGLVVAGRDEVVVGGEFVAQGSQMQCMRIPVDAHRRLAPSRARHALARTYFEVYLASRSNHAAVVVHAEQRNQGGVRYS